MIKFKWYKLGRKPYWEWETVGDFQNTADIETQQLPGHKRRHALLAVFDDLQSYLNAKARTV